MNLMNGARLMVVDDEQVVREFFNTLLPKQGVTTFSCSNGKEAKEAMVVNSVDMVLTDLKMPEMDGMQLLRWIQGFQPTIPVIMMTGHSSIENAVEAMRNGAFDYLTKPITDLSRLDVTLQRAMQHRLLLVENQQLKRELGGMYRFDNMIGKGLKMQRIFDILATVAPTQATVLVQGASGTGKELVARAVHQNSPRANMPFVRVNCAALPEGLIESELFGHEKGAFTGAVRTTQGRFEAAHGGTLLLDEISEIPLNLQAKLLRALQEREIQPLGTNISIKVDVRVIATTNVDLEKAVSLGKFREDLYYRLNVIPIKLPPLIARREDIPVLSYYFLERFAKIHKRNVRRISDRAMQYLVNAPWPGNVRELENTIERAVIMCNTEEIALSDFFMMEAAPARSRSRDGSKTNVSQPRILTLAEVEKQHIMKTLFELNGHRSKAADAMEISIRTLRNKLQEYRISGEKF